MLYKEEVERAIANLQKIQSRINQIYKYHKLDRDVCTKEMQVSQKVLKKILDMDVLEQTQKSLFEEES